jgi:dTDP-4-dehydrorhamnose 3,5-epimerase
MRSIPLYIQDLILFEPDVFPDERGEFFECFNQRRFEEATGRALSFVQENHSVSAKGVLRGLHYQLPPHAQAKLVRVIAGAARDVVVDIRRHSPTFGKWVGTLLSASNRRLLWIPEGFAHGFVALENKTELVYKTNRYYSPSSERCIIWNDPAIGIEWEYAYEPRLSGKDRQGIPLAQSELFD